jgi:putative phosphoribosyl transferase
MNTRTHRLVGVPVGNVELMGELFIPPHAKAMVIFSHGSGSSRLSIRNKMVANYLHDRQFGTLLFDLLTEDEDKHYHNRFDIDLLTKRLVAVTRWLEKQEAVKNLPMGYFGASTGAASALKAAATLPMIQAVVSRGGRPDLVLHVLPLVEAPTLLIVGSLDHDVLQLNELALSTLVCEKKLEIVDGASHLFEEEGKIQMVCEKATSWFEHHLQVAQPYQ